MARRRFWLPVGLAIFLVLSYYTLVNGSGFDYTGSWRTYRAPNLQPGVASDENYFWRKLPMRHRVKGMKRFPGGRPKQLPKVQAAFEEESVKEQAIWVKRQQAVKDAFKRCWNSYSANAFGQDEMAPLSGASKETSSGWGATLVDTLDMLWILGMEAEFEEAVVAATEIDFEKSAMNIVNIFEINIRYLGGFLAAYDLSGDQRLLRKAREVGDMLYVAFDTPNRMPMIRWDLENAANGGDQEAAGDGIISEIGSLCLEFTRLSLLTGDPRWFDSIERIREVMEQQQHTTKLPGMWPVGVNPRDKVFNAHDKFALGAMADSAYEYLPKMYGLVGGLIPSYKKMYEDAMSVAIKRNFWRPMLPDTPDILISGGVQVGDRNGKPVYDPDYQGQQLVCFVGGMLALGGRLSNRPEHIKAAERLNDGCIWAHEAMPLGIMPETFYMVPCPDEQCEWDESLWKRDVLERDGEKDRTSTKKADKIIEENSLPDGFTQISDRRYLLRPQAIESVFTLYRITGRRNLRETAWKMFEAVQRHTTTTFGNAALADVAVDNVPPKINSMESFWMGETLKYYYLIFSDPDVISLDEWVFNTQGHPLRRLVP